VDDPVCDRDSEAKAKRMLHADKKHNARLRDVQEGDKVLLKQERKNKLTKTFSTVY